LSLSPSIEGLEERVVLSAIMWNTALSPTGGSWDTATNWVGDQVPGPSDNAVIDLPGAGGTVTLDAGVTDTIKSLSTNAATSINISSDTLSIATASSIGAGLTMTGGTLTGAGTLTVSGATSWAGGTMSGSGVTNADGGLTIGSTNISSGEYLAGRTLNNFGAATLASYSDTNSTYYNLQFFDGATFDNEAGATFSFINDSNIYDGGGTPDGGTFVNAGTLSKTGSSGTSVIDIALNSTGAIDVQSGIISLQGGGTLGGTIAASTGAMLAVDANTITLANGAAFSGAGTVAVRGGTLTIPAGTATSAAATTVLFSGGTISGAGTLTLSGPFIWTGGTMSGTGTTNASGGLTIGSTNISSAQYLAGRTLNNFGAATLASYNDTNSA
jgi:hypothetical protein